MKKLPTNLLVLSVMVGWLFVARANCLAQQTQDMLPAWTKFHLSVANQQKFDDLFATTELGKWLSSPAMKPFLDDLPRQLRSKASDHPLSALSIDLGVESGELDGLSDGEVAWALVHPAGDRPSRVLIADVSNRQDQADALLRKIVASMNRQKAKKTESDIDGTTVTVFDIPAAAADLAAAKLVYFQKDNHLVFAETIAVARDLVQHIGSASDDRLSGEVGYQQVVKECRERAGDEPPDAVLFLVPVDFSEALNEMSPEDERSTSQNLAIARKHNFDAILALGSFISVGRAPFDFHFRVSVHAPQPWKNGMRVCKFPNRKMTLPDWVRGDNQVCAMINVDFESLSRYVGPLFDDVVGEGDEGLYDELKNTMREDPQGPKVDIDREIFGQLSPQTILLARDALPAMPDSPQRLIAIPTTDEAAMAAVVKKLLEADQNVEAVQVDGHDAFISYIPEEADEFSSLLDMEPQDQDRQLGFVTCIANGHLMLATDLKILEEALTVADGNSMGQRADYENFWRQQPLGEEVFVQFFGRLDDSLRVNYELIRQGKEPTGGKSFQGLLQTIAAGAPPAMQELKLDGSKLPMFDEVEQYFGPAGLVGVATDDGWYLEAFIPKKQ